MFWLLTILLVVVFVLCKILASIKDIYQRRNKFRSGATILGRGWEDPFKQWDQQGSTREPEIKGKQELSSSQIYVYTCMCTNIHLP